MGEYQTEQIANGFCKDMNTILEKDFKVGDYVKSDTGRQVVKITEIIDNRYFKCEESGCGVFFLDEFEHAKPPKGETQNLQLPQEIIKCDNCRNKSRCYYGQIKPNGDGCYYESKENQKIEKLENEYRVTEIIKTINQLVDVVNELRGAE